MPKRSAEDGAPREKGTEGYKARKYTWGLQPGQNEAGAAEGPIKTEGWACRKGLCLTTETAARQDLTGASLQDRCAVSPAGSQLLHTPRALRLHSSNQKNLGRQRHAARTSWRTAVG